jgi:molybdopterin converting factor small subunit
MAQVRQATGRAVEQVEVGEACTVRELLVQQANGGDPALWRLLLNDSGNPQPGLLVFVGDEQVSTDAVRPLRDGDAVTVLSPMAGG